MGGGFVYAADCTLYTGYRDCAAVLRGNTRKIDLNNTPKKAGNAPFKKIASCILVYMQQFGAENIFQLKMSYLL